MYRNYIIHVWIWKFLPGVVRRMLGRGRCEPRPFFKDNFLYEFNLKSLNFPGWGGGVLTPHLDLHKVLYEDFSVKRVFKLICR